MKNQFTFTYYLKHLFCQIIPSNLTPDIAQMFVQKEFL